MFSLQYNQIIVLYLLDIYGGAYLVNNQSISAHILARINAEERKSILSKVCRNTADRTEKIQH